MVKIDLISYSPQVLSNLNKVSFSSENGNDINIFWLEASGSGIKSRVITPLMHRHSFFELHIILEGSVKCALADKTIVLDKGEFILLSPNTMHRIESAEEEFLRLSVTFQVKAGSYLDQMFSSKSYISGDMSEDTIKAVDFIVENGTSAGPYAEKLCANRIFEIVYLICKGNYTSSSFTNRQHTVNDYLEKAEKYILDNSHLFLNCEEVAAYCHISAKQLKRIFEKHERMSLHKYLHSCKLKDAQYLIENTNLSFSKISVMLGFNSDKYFNAFFKNNSGMSPGQYRKNFGK